MNQIVLSICIPLHNRSEHLAGHLGEILRVDSDEFDVIISDTSEVGRRFEDVVALRDERLKIYTAPETVPPMENWYLALEHADGIFALHLNDRDRLDCENLPAFIAFLKEHAQYNGGACKRVDKVSLVLCDSIQAAVMSVPYFSLHTTGLFFNVERYKEIPDRKEFFSRKYGTHPHDIVLGRLSACGGLIIYTRPLWEMASDDIFRKYKSGVCEKKDLFFEPERRLEELTVMLSELKKLEIDPALKERKVRQTITNYLFLATFNYFYFIESDYQTSHYGITPKHLSTKQKIAEIRKTLAAFGQECGFSYFDRIRYGFQIYKRWFMYKLNGALKRIPVDALRNSMEEWSIKRQIRSGTLLR